MSNEYVREGLARGFRYLLERAYINLPDYPKDVAVAALASGFVFLLGGIAISKSYDSILNVKKAAKQKAIDLLKNNWGKILTGLVSAATVMAASRYISTDMVDNAASFVGGGLAGLGTWLAGKAYLHKREEDKRKSKANDYSAFVPPKYQKLGYQKPPDYSAFVPPKYKRLGYQREEFIAEQIGIPPALIHSAALAKKSGSMNVWLQRNTRKYGRQKVMLAMRMAQKKMKTRPSYNQTILNRRRKVK